MFKVGDVLFYADPLSGLGVFLRRVRSVNEVSYGLDSMPRRNRYSSYLLGKDEAEAAFVRLSDLTEVECIIYDVTRLLEEGN